MFLIVLVHVHFFIRMHMLLVLWPVVIGPLLERAIFFRVVGFFVFMSLILFSVEVKDFFRVFVLALFLELLSFESFLLAEFLLCLELV